MEMNGTGIDDLFQDLNMTLSDFAETFMALTDVVREGPRKIFLFLVQVLLT